MSLPPFASERQFHWRVKVLVPLRIYVGMGKRLCIGLNQLVDAVWNNDFFILHHVVKDVAALLTAKVANSIALIR